MSSQEASAVSVEQKSKSSQQNGHEHASHHKRRFFQIASKLLPQRKKPEQSAANHKKLVFHAVNCIQALGVVFGDIGTGPLYVFKSIFEREIPEKHDVLGALCLIFYSITLVIGIKYLIFVLMADYKGQGGTFALLSLLMYRERKTAINSPEIERRDWLDEDIVELPVIDDIKIEVASPKILKKVEEEPKIINEHEFISQRTLASLHKSPFLRKPQVAAFYTTLSIVAACLLFGDGIITPAISVLSAVEGLKLVSDSLDPAIIPLTCAILFILFMIQQFGMHKVGNLFGPIMIVWFTAIGVVGIYQITFYPEVFAALSPAEGYRFFSRNGSKGWRLLGSIVLCITGVEGMYADMGHFGKNSVRFSFAMLVYPSIVLNYLGQASLLVRRPEDIEDPFFNSTPKDALWPMLILSTLAAVIASQALISGALSTMQQAISNDFMPRMKVIHTSDDMEGQIFIPTLNYFLMVVCIILVVAFKTSTALSHTFGIAVCIHMMTTTFFYASLAKLRWKWNTVLWAMLIGLFLIVDFAFLSSALLKIPTGGWFPLGFTLLLGSLMLIWREGRKILLKKTKQCEIPWEILVRELHDGNIRRCKGTAVFLTPVAEGVPLSLTQLVRHLPLLHEHVIFLTIEYKHVPHVHHDHVEIEDLEQKGFYRIVARYGYRQAGNISIQNLLAECQQLLPELDLNLDDLSFFVRQEKIKRDKTKWFGHQILVRIFNTLIQLHHNAAGGFGIPSERMISLGAMVVE